MLLRPNTPKLLLLAGSIALTGACAASRATVSDTVGHTTLTTADGRVVGEGTLRSVSGQISVVITGHDLAPGAHGLHLHAIGKCEGPAFASAGPHLNPGNNQHGSQNPAGTHLGDLPNLTIAADGKGTVSFTLPGNVADASTALFDADGSAIVLHAAEDDYRTDPSGNSGARIACGILVPG